MTGEPFKNGFLDGAPWQFRLFAWIASSFILPIALLGFYLAQDAGLIPSLVRTTHANVMATQAAVVGHIQRTDELIARLVTAQRIACENNAKDFAARRNCENIR